MQYYKYKIKPEIKTAKDLLEFLTPIPPKHWCVDTRDNYAGSCCVLGHLDNAYGRGEGRDGFTDRELACVNNGVRKGEPSCGSRKAVALLTGKAVKARVLGFIARRVKTSSIKCNTQ